MPGVEMPSGATAVEGPANTVVEPVTGQPSHGIVPSDDEIVIKLIFPSQFRDVLDAEGAFELYSDQSERTGKNEKCEAVVRSSEDVSITFLCRQSAAGTFYTQVRGFDLPPLSLGAGTGNDGLAIVSADDMKLKAGVVVMPASLPGGEYRAAGLPRLALDQPWPQVLATGSNALVDAYFRAIDPQASAVSALCPADAPLTAASLMAEDVVIIGVACDFAFVDIGAAQLAIADGIEISPCLEGDGLGRVCVFVPGETPRLSQRAEDASGFVIVDAALKPGGNALDDVLRFSEATALFSGEADLRVGVHEARYVVSAASLLAPSGAVCGTQLKSSGGGAPLVLAGMGLSAFQCAEGYPSALQFELAAEDANSPIFPAQIVMQRALSGSADSFDVGLFDVFSSLNLRLAAQDGRAMPSFFVVRLFSDVIECLGTGAPLVEQSVSRIRPIIQIGGEVLAHARPAIQILNGEQRITECQVLEPGALVSGVEETSLVAALDLKFIRPAGPYSLIVLSPTQRMAEEGWRNIFQTVLRDLVTGWASAATPRPVDIFQITESRALRLIVAGEDYVDLPETGGSQSIQGRFDTIRYDATNASPLDDINIIQRNIADLEIDSVVLIVDSSNELFQPEEMGSLYHWLVNRNVKIQVISIGKCDMWVELSKNIENKVSCFDLETIEDLPPQERYAQLENLLGNYTALERD